MSAGLEDELRRGVAQLGLGLSDIEFDQLLDYLGLIGKWNQVYNLTAVRDPADMLRLHLLDCLALIQPLRTQTAGQPVAVLDVGSGAGLPGVVIAICCPETQVDCVDAVAKKAAFIQQVAGTLKLANLRGVHDRVEQLSGRYRVVVSRAFAPLADFVTLSSAALEESGVWLAMKAKLPADELAALPPNVRVFHVERLKVPGLDAERCLVWLKPAVA
jgi:16S rRNA (guanine527-N7)-methyltransferase